MPVIDNSVACNQEHEVLGTLKPWDVDTTVGCLSFKPMNVCVTQERFEVATDIY